MRIPAKTQLDLMPIQASITRNFDLAVPTQHFHGENFNMKTLQICNSTNFQIETYDSYGQLSSPIPVLEVTHCKEVTDLTLFGEVTRSLEFLHSLPQL